MTDKARELLERAYQYIPLSSITSQEIRAYLAQPEVKREALSEEEATKIFKQIFGGAYPCMADDMKMVRAVEKHHRIEKLK